MDVVVRPVEASDIDACFDLESLCFEPSEAAGRESIKKRIGLFPEGFFVAEIKGRVVGHINSAATDKDDITDEALKGMTGHVSGGGNMVVFSLAVHPEFRKCKVARRLLDRFVESSRDAGRRKVLLICKSPLIPYYERYGFLYGGPSASTHGGQQWHEMMLPL